MDIVVDTPLVDSLAREFAIRFVEAMARQLHKSPATNFDIFNLTEDAQLLLFDVCFFAIFEFEEQSGFELGGKTYTPRPVFERGAPQIFVTGDTSFHGTLDGAVIAEGLDLARASLSR